LVPSLVVGDSILLPLFNLRAWMLLGPHLGNLDKRLRMQLVAVGISSIVLCSAIMSYEHVLWKNDPYSGFIKYSVGHLSRAGAWHAVFASFEMALIVWCFFVSCRWAKRVPRVALLKMWGVFWLYSFLSVFDYLFRRLRLSMHGFRLSDAIGLSAALLGSLAYLLLRYLSADAKSSKIGRAIGNGSASSQV
jgi:hypothetical protein